MRKTLFRLGWIVLLLLSAGFFVQAYIVQDLPRFEPWQWAMLAIGIALLWASRDRDDVLRHHVV